MLWKLHNICHLPWNSSTPTLHQIPETSNFCKYLIISKRTERAWLKPHQSNLEHNTTPTMRQSVITLTCCRHQRRPFAPSWRWRLASAGQSSCCCRHWRRSMMMDDVTATANERRCRRPCSVLISRPHCAHKHESCTFNRLSYAENVSLEHRIAMTMQKHACRTWIIASHTSLSLQISEKRRHYPCLSLFQ